MHDRQPDTGSRALPKSLFAKGEKFCWPPPRFVKLPSCLLDEPPMNDKTTEILFVESNASQRFH
jgi:hypothetical protein